jgi:hypothetical protein
MLKFLLRLHRAYSDAFLLPSLDDDQTMERWNRSYRIYSCRNTIEVSDKVFVCGFFLWLLTSAITFAKAAEGPSYASAETLTATIMVSIVVGPVIALAAFWLMWRAYHIRRALTRVKPDVDHMLDDYRRVVRRRAPEAMVVLSNEVHHRRAISQALKSKQTTAANLVASAERLPHVGHLTELPDLEALAAEVAEAERLLQVSSSQHELLCQHFDQYVEFAVSNAKLWLESQAYQSAQSSLRLEQARADLDEMLGGPGRMAALASSDMEDSLALSDTNEAVQAARQ